MLQVPAVERFKIHVNERGEKFDEEVEVDTEKQTERYHVPSRGDIPEADYLYDFKLVSSALNMSRDRSFVCRNCLHVHETEIKSALHDRKYLNTNHTTY